MSYYITAVACSSPWLHAEHPLTVRPPAPENRFSPYPARFCGVFRSLKLLPENEGRKLSFKEKSRSFFNPSLVPHFSFELFVEVPKDIVIGDRITFSIRLKPNPDHSTAPEPTVVLTSFNVELTATTDVRTKDIGFEHRSQSSVTVHSTVNRSTSQICTLTKENDCRAIIRTNAVAGIYPSFSTCNICHKHVLKVRILLQCAHEKFDQKMERPVQVCTSHYEAKDTEVRLPTYEEALSVPQLAEFPTSPRTATTNSHANASSS